MTELNMKELSMEEMENIDGGVKYGTLAAGVIATGAGVYFGSIYGAYAGVVTIISAFEG